MRIGDQIRRVETNLSGGYIRRGLGAGESD